MKWTDVAKELLRSQKDIQKKAKEIGTSSASVREGLMDAFYMDKSRMVDSV